MEFSDFCLKMHLSEDLQKQIFPYREELMANSDEKLPFFMEQKYYEKYFPWCSDIDTEKVFPLMEQVAAVTAADPAAARYASMLHYAYFHSDHDLYKLPWDEPLSIYGENTGIFNLMMAISCVRHIRRVHEKLGLREDFTRNQAHWIDGAITLYMSGNQGRTGFILKTLYWLRLATKGELFRIGRLEFLERPYGENMPLILRRKSDGRLAVLCRNWTFDSQNFRVAANSGKVDFATELEYFDGKVKGTLIEPCGFPLRDHQEVFDLAQWEKVCDTGEPSMTVHIPAGGGMTMDKIRESLVGAKQFFLEKFAKKITIFTCESWLLNPVWATELPESNFAAFQKNVYMTPCQEPEGMPGCHFVYGVPECDPREKECKTSLHRAFCNVFDRGEPLRVGGMFVMADDAERFGDMIYRRDYQF